MGVLKIQASGVVDSLIREGNPTSNFGGAPMLQVRSKKNNCRALLSFDFSSLPADATITQAYLKIYKYSEVAGTTGRTYWACRLTRTDWIEMGVTWNTYDGTNAWTAAGGDYTQTDKSSATVPADNNWMSFDVTALVQYAQSNTNKVAHFLLRDSVEGESTEYRSYFYSSEYDVDTTLRPILEITYTQPLITTDHVLPVEAKSYMSKDGLMKPEILSEIDYDSSLPVYVPGMFARDLVMMVETISPVSRDATLPADEGLKIEKDAVSGVESLGFMQSDHTVTIEIVRLVEAGRIIPVATYYDIGSGTTVFIFSGGVIQIAKRPVRPFPVNITQFQPGGLDAGGSRYVYTKSQIRRKRFRLTFRRVDTATRDSLLTMIEAVRREERFTYVDHEGVYHSVRLDGDFETTEVGAGKHDFEISLVEDETL